MLVAACAEPADDSLVTPPPVADEATDRGEDADAAVADIAEPLAADIETLPEAPPEVPAQPVEMPDLSTAFPRRWRFPPRS